MIGADRAAGRSGRTDVVAVTIVAEAILQCKASKSRVSDIRFRLPKKNPLPGVSRKMMHGCAGRDITGLKTKAVGIVGDADGFCLESGQGC